MVLRNSGHPLYFRAASLIAVNICFAAPCASFAQTNNAPKSSPDSQSSGDVASNGASEGANNQIIVIGPRLIVGALRDTPVEQSYDPNRLQSYNANSAGELIAEIATENGEDSPTVLVNGQPVSDLGDISDLPVEAIKQIEVLPPGSAAKVGGPPGKRTYNIVLKTSVRALIVTASRQMATEGDWANSRGDVIFTLIKGQDRINLSVRTGRSDPLFEADRGLFPTVEFGSFSPAGNIIPLSGTEIDPAFNALAGRPVVSAALSASMANPTLSDLLVGANRLNPSEAQFYRTLRGEVKNSDISLSGSKKLSDWLTFSFNARLGWTESANSSGLPSGRFLVSADNSFTPFSRPVVIAQSDRTRPLRSQSKFDSGSISATFNGTLNDWRWAVTGRYEKRHSQSRYARLAPGSSGFIPVPRTTNPFDGTLSSLLLLSQSVSDSYTKVQEVNEELEGPLFNLPAGPVRLTVKSGILQTQIDSIDPFTTNRRALDRTEISARASLNIPLTAEGGNGDIGIGATDISAEYGALRFDQNSVVQRHALSFNWRPSRWLRLSASTASDRRAVALELLGAPTITIDNVRYYDPLTNSEALVTIRSGGSSVLGNQSTRTNRVSITASPMRKHGVQLSAEYFVTAFQNQIGALPPPSPAVVLAFPERFQRDGQGRLILVDNRTVNFEQQRNREVRVSLSVNTPISSPAKATPATPPLMLNLNVAYNRTLSSTTVIRNGLDSVDLLKGGAIGIGGGGQRFTYNATAALSHGASGVRVNWLLRSNSFLNTGAATNPDRLTFGQFSTFDLRLFTDIETMVPSAKLLKGTKLTLSADNIFNTRQSVSSRLGIVPTYFQPRFRDPVGRTISVELRKVF
jgi:iron complex outermembrane recepter protein